MSHSQPFSISHNNPEADDSSTVFDADTVIPDEVPSLPAMPPLPTLIATATTTENLYNNNESISSTSIQEESPANTISEFLRRINSRHCPATITTTATATATATVTRSEEMSTNQSSLSSSSKKRSVITNSSSFSSRKKTRQSSRLKRQRSDAKWKSKFEKLCAHKQLHGHTNVHRNNKQLGIWINTQRKEYKKFQANKKAYITKERIQMLESIGFEWELHSDWNNRFNELKAYKEKYGRTNVSQRMKENKKLGNWVKKQRREYKKFHENKKSSMTNERIDMLNSIGFQWECRPDCAPRC